MFKKTLALFVSGKLKNYARFFGCMALGVAAITGMAWAYCGLNSTKQKCRATGEASDIRAEEPGPGQ